MGWHVFPEVENANTACYGRSCKASINFVHISFPLHAKTFPVFGKKNRNLDLSPLKILVDSWRIFNDFVFVYDRFNRLRLVIEKKKCVSLWSSSYPKIHNNKWLVFQFSVICLIHCSTRWRDTVTSASGQHMITAKDCSKPSISRQRWFFFRFFTFRNSLTKNRTPIFLWRTPFRKLTFTPLTKTCPSSSLSTGRGPIEDFENMLLNRNLKLDLGIFCLLPALFLAILPRISCKVALNSAGL